MKNVVTSLQAAVNWGALSTGVLLAALTAHLVSPWAWCVLVPLFASEGVRMWMGTVIARAMADQREAKQQAFEAQLMAMTAEQEPE